MANEGGTKEKRPNKSQTFDVVDRLYAARVRQLYKQSHIGVIASLANSIILISLLWELVPHSASIIWISVMLLITLLRYALFYRYRRSSLTPANAGGFSIGFIIGVSLYGMVWGSSGIFLFPIESIAHQAFLALMLGGMVVGAAAVFSIIMKAYFAFALPALIPVILRFFLLGDDIHRAMGGMGLLAGIIISYIAKRMNVVNVSSMKLQFENIDLIDHLAAEKDRIEKINEDLKCEIGERERIEEAHRVSERRYRNLFDSISDFIYTHDLEGRFLTVNRATAQTLGYTPSELVGKSVSDFMLPKYRHAFRQQYLEQIKKRGFFTGVSRYVSSDGTHHYVEYRNILVQQDGNKPYVSGVGRDITERIEAEMEVGKLEQQLFQSQKMEAIGTMAGGVAHNFRNILAVVSMNSELVRMKYRDDQVLQEIADVISSYSKRGEHLIEGLMQFSRRESKRDYQPLNLDEVIRETYELTSISFDKMINIRLQIPEPLTIMGDHSGISQVLMNLCTNAMDAMPGGGELHIEAKKEGEKALVIIADTGQGMDKETQERCFDPFFTTKEVNKGTGLGLSTTYGIVKEHGGDIHVYSELGQGTTFNLYFPLASSDERVLEKSSTEIVRGHGEKVLIVDDEREMCRVMEELVKRLGYKAAYAKNGNSAIVKYKSWRPDVVLLDRNMPDMDGVSCSEKIMDYDPNAKIVIISGYDEKGPSGIDEEKKRLIKGYLTKPIEMARLSEELAQVLG
ncbi:MAG: PAS domain S-box protein [Deltaproteobacteria bacterium]|nr:MAG: PAS domain S-box protein [Deltaproteobacteria bacterium]